MKNNTETGYIRLLSYQQACEVIKYYNDKYDKGSFTHAFITSGGVCLQGFEKQFLDAQVFLDGKGWRYEFSKEHPMGTTKKIINILGLK
jgi:hypothetical protein